jgi:secondary thiamine-phosphate synthase enzyme
VTVVSRTLEYETTSGTDVLDLTSDLVEFVTGSGVGDGILVVFSPGSTAGLTTLEFESGAVSDLKRTIEELVPSGREYAHDRRWGDGNGYSHVRSALVGPSVAVPVTGGALELGTWQQVVLCDFDNRPRRRRIRLRLMGESRSALDGSADT